MNLASRIRKLGPCQLAVEWLADYTDPEKAWAACARGDWLLWFLGHVSSKPYSAGRKRLVHCLWTCITRMDEKPIVQTSFLQWLLTWFGYIILLHQNSKL